MSKRDPKTRQLARPRRNFMWAAGVGAVSAFTDSDLLAKVSGKSHPRPVINVRRLGAKGDGLTNDTSAFQQAAQIINANGSGTILIPPGTYIVGQQTLTGARGEGNSYRADPIIRIQDCPGPVRIIGLESELPTHKPVLKAADGLKFGSFDPITGHPVNPDLPFTDYDYRADAYNGMIQLLRNASVQIRNLDLDGNIHKLDLGGFWGDVGRQCAGSGIWCYGNDAVVIESVDSHHHGTDGILIGSFDGLDMLRPHHLIDCRFEFNARQGLSWVGSSGLRAQGCRFAHTGRARFNSPPSAGVDVEPENAQMSNGLFEDCEILDNAGGGVISDTTPPGSSVQGVTFKRTRILGTTHYSILVRNADFEFESCEIIGTLATNPARVFPPEDIRFINCNIHDDHPQAFRPGLLIDCSAGRVMLFDGCTITTVGQRLANISGGRVRNCHFVARLSSDFATSTTWMAILYFSHVLDCVFEDQITNRQGPTYTINVANGSPPINIIVVPTDGRLAFLYA